MTGANRAIAPMFIINPLQSKAAFSLHATHPPTKERIQILRGMAGAGYAAYEEAFRKVSGRGNCVGAVTLKSADETAIRAPTPEPEPKKEAVARAREAVDLIDRLAGFLLIPCVCGLRIKVPPDCKRDGLACPRCGRMHLIPVATAAAGKPGAARPPTRYQRKGTGWETFRCSCGRTMQISPSFDSRSLHCRNCNRRVEIIPANERE
jgi:heat shock protein HtpX